ncbi:MAG: type I restriction enzyme HsdR N-terminal domain-containing protein [Chloroflexota bacterium]
MEAKDSLIPPQDKNLVSLREFGQLQPEEMVVKYVLNILCNDLGFNPDDIDTEFPIQMGISNKRADIVVFRDKMPHTISNAYIIIECKRADKMHKERHINQLKSYMAASPNVRYGVLASTNWRVWEMIITHRGRVYNEIDTLPDANNENTEFIYQPPTPDTLYEHKNNI